MEKIVKFKNAVAKLNAQRQHEELNTNNLYQQRRRQDGMPFSDAKHRWKKI